MADLDFHGTPEVRLAKLQDFCRRINSDFYGNGRPGMMDSVQDFMTEHRTEKAIEQKRHSENKARLNLIIGLLGILVAILTALIAWKGLAKTAELVSHHPTISTASLSRY